MYLRLQLQCMWSDTILHIQRTPVSPTFQVGVHNQILNAHSLINEINLCFTWRNGVGYTLMICSKFKEKSCSSKRNFATCSNRHTEKQRQFLQQANLDIYKPKAHSIPNDHDCHWNDILRHGTHHKVSSIGDLFDLRVFVWLPIMSSDQQHKIYT